MGADVPAGEDDGEPRLRCRRGEPAGASRPLALRTGSGQVLYPHWALEPDLAEGLAEVVRRLPESLASSWTVASWLGAPEAELGGQRPLDALRAGRTEQVLLVAEHWSGQLQR